MVLPSCKMGIFLLLFFFIHTVNSAPALAEDTAIGNVQRGRVARMRGCYHNYVHFENGERISTNEPCLNCTCSDSMLMCYLRVCPYVKPIGEECTVEKSDTDCCPKITCPEVPKENESDDPDHVGKRGQLGCFLEAKHYDEGEMLPHDPKNPCEVCYCIRNSTRCALQECELKIDGCVPVYNGDQCCPRRYNCSYAYEVSKPSTTPGYVFEGERADCIAPDGSIVKEGEELMPRHPCEHCYCLKGELMCSYQECHAPGDNCTPIQPPPGHCCPERYVCDESYVPSALSLTHDTFIADPPKKESGVKTSYQKVVTVKGAPALKTPTKVESVEFYNETKSEINLSSSPSNHDIGTGIPINAETGEIYKQAIDLKNIKSSDEDLLMVPGKISNTATRVSSDALEVSVKKVSAKQPEFKEVSSKKVSRIKTRPEDLEHGVVVGPYAPSNKGVFEEVTDYVGTPPPSLLSDIGSVKDASFVDGRISHYPSADSITKYEVSGSVTHRDNLYGLKYPFERVSIPTNILRTKRPNNTAIVRPTGVAFRWRPRIPGGIKGGLQRYNTTNYQFKPTGIKGGYQQGFQTHHVYSVKGGQQGTLTRPILPIGAIPGETTAGKWRPPVVSIPGEGVCRIRNRVYQSGEFVESNNICMFNCQCVNGIVYCDKIECAGPPAGAGQCTGIRVLNECCPRYQCTSSFTRVTPKPSEKTEATTQLGKSTPKPISKTPSVTEHIEESGIPFSPGKDKPSETDTTTGNYPTVTPPEKEDTSLSKVTTVTTEAETTLQPQSEVSSTTEKPSVTQQQETTVPSLMTITTEKIYSVQTESSDSVEKVSVVGTEETKSPLVSLSETTIKPQPDVSTTTIKASVPHHHETTVSSIKHFTDEKMSSSHPETSVSVETASVAGTEETKSPFPSVSDTTTQPQSKISITTEKPGVTQQHETTVSSITNFASEKISTTQTESPVSVQTASVVGTEETKSPFPSISETTSQPQPEISITTEKPDVTQQHETTVSSITNFASEKIASTQTESPVSVKTASVVDTEETSSPLVSLSETTLKPHSDISTTTIKPSVTQLHETTVSSIKNFAMENISSTQTESPVSAETEFVDDEETKYPLPSAFEKTLQPQYAVSSTTEKPSVTQHHETTVSSITNSAVEKISSTLTESPVSAETVSIADKEQTKSPLTSAFETTLQPQSEVSTTTEKPIVTQDHETKDSSINSFTVETVPSSQTESPVSVETAYISDTEERKSPLTPVSENASQPQAGDSTTTKKPGVTQHHETTVSSITNFATEKISSSQTESPVSIETASVVGTEETKSPFPSVSETTSQPQSDISVRTEKPDVTQQHETTVSSITNFASEKISTTQTESPVSVQTASVVGTDEIKSPFPSVSETASQPQSEVSITTEKPDATEQHETTVSSITNFASEKISSTQTESPVSVETASVVGTDETKSPSSSVSETTSQPHSEISITTEKQDVTQQHETRVSSITNFASEKISTTQTESPVSVQTASVVGTEETKSPFPSVSETASQPQSEVSITTKKPDVSEQHETTVSSITNFASEKISSTQTESPVSVETASVVGTDETKSPFPSVSETTSQPHSEISITTEKPDVTQQHETTVSSITNFASEKISSTQTETPVSVETASVVDTEETRSPVVSLSETTLKHQSDISTVKPSVTQDHETTVSSITKFTDEKISSSNPEIFSSVEIAFVDGAVEKNSHFPSVSETTLQPMTGVSTTSETPRVTPNHESTVSSVTIFADGKQSSQTESPVSVETESVVGTEETKSPFPSVSETTSQPQSEISVTTENSSVTQQHETTVSSINFAVDKLTSSETESPVSLETESAVGTEETKSTLLSLSETTVKPQPDVSTTTIKESITEHHETTVSSIKNFTDEKISSSHPESLVSVETASVDSTEETKSPFPSVSETTLLSVSGLSTTTEKPQIFQHHESTVSSVKNFAVEKISSTQTESPVSIETASVVGTEETKSPLVSLSETTLKTQLDILSTTVEPSVAQHPETTVYSIASFTDEKISSSHPESLVSVETGSILSTEETKSPFPSVSETTSQPQSEVSITTEKSGVPQHYESTVSSVTNLTVLKKVSQTESPVSVETASVTGTEETKSPMVSLSETTVKPQLDVATTTVKSSVIQNHDTTVHSTASFTDEKIYSHPETLVSVETASLANTDETKFSFPSVSETSLQPQSEVSSTTIKPSSSQHEPATQKYDSSSVLVTTLLPETEHKTLHEKQAETGGKATQIFPSDKFEKVVTSEVEHETATEIFSNVDDRHTVLPLGTQNTSLHEIKFSESNLGLSGTTENSENSPATEKTTLSPHTDHSDIFKISTTEAVRTESDSTTANFEVETTTHYLQTNHSLPVKKTADEILDTLEDSLRTSSPIISKLPLSTWTINEKLSEETTKIALSTTIDSTKKSDFNDDFSSDKRPSTNNLFTEEKQSEKTSSMVTLSPFHTEFSDSVESSTINVKDVTSDSMTTRSSSTLSSQSEHLDNSNQKTVETMGTSKYATEETFVTGTTKLPFEKDLSSFETSTTKFSGTNTDFSFTTSDDKLEKLSDEKIFKHSTETYETSTANLEDSTNDSTKIKFEVENTFIPQEETSILGRKSNYSASEVTKETSSLTSVTDTVPKSEIFTVFQDDFVPEVISSTSENTSADDRKLLLSETTDFSSTGNTAVTIQAINNKSSVETFAHDTTILSYETESSSSSEFSSTVKPSSITFSTAETTALSSKDDESKEKITTTQAPLTSAVYNLKFEEIPESTQDSSEILTDATTSFHETDNPDTFKDSDEKAMKKASSVPDFISTVDEEKVSHPKDFSLFQTTEASNNTKYDFESSTSLKTTSVVPDSITGDSFTTSEINKEVLGSSTHISPEHFEDVSTLSSPQKDLNSFDSSRKNDEDAKKATMVLIPIDHSTQTDDFRTTLNPTKVDDSSFKTSTISVPGISEGSSITLSAAVNTTLSVPTENSVLFETSEPEILKTSSNTFPQTDDLYFSQSTAAAVDTSQDSFDETPEDNSEKLTSHTNVPLINKNENATSFETTERFQSTSESESVTLSPEIKDSTTAKPLISVDPGYSTVATIKFSLSDIKTINPETEYSSTTDTTKAITPEKASPDHTDADLSFETSTSYASDTVHNSPITRYGTTAESDSSPEISTSNFEFSTSNQQQESTEHSNVNYESVSHEETLSQLLAASPENMVSHFDSFSTTKLSESASDSPITRPGTFILKEIIPQKSTEVPENLVLNTEVEHDIKTYEPPNYSSTEIIVQDETTFSSQTNDIKKITHSSAGDDSRDTTLPTTRAPVTVSVLTSTEATAIPQKEYTSKQENVSTIDDSTVLLLKEIIPQKSTDIPENLVSNTELEHGIKTSETVNYSSTASIAKDETTFSSKTNDVETITQSSEGNNSKDMTISTTKSPVTTSVPSKSTEAATIPQKEHTSTQEHVSTIDHSTIKYSEFNTFGEKTTSPQRESYGSFETSNAPVSEAITGSPQPESGSIMKTTVVEELSVSNDTTNVGYTETETSIVDDIVSATDLKSEDHFSTHPSKHEIATQSDKITELSSSDTFTETSKVTNAYTNTVDDALSSGTEDSSTFSDSISNTVQHATHLMENSTLGSTAVSFQTTGSSPSKISATDFAFDKTDFTTKISPEDTSIPFSSTEHPYSVTDSLSETTTISTIKEDTLSPELLNAEEKETVKVSSSPTTFSADSVTSFLQKDKTTTLQPKPSPSIIESSTPRIQEYLSDTSTDAAADSTKSSELESSSSFHTSILPVSETFDDTSVKQSATQTTIKSISSDPQREDVSLLAKTTTDLKTETKTTVIPESSTPSVFQSSFSSLEVSTVGPMDTENDTSVAHNETTIEGEHFSGFMTSSPENLISEDKIASSSTLFPSHHQEFSVKDNDFTSFHESVSEHKTTDIDRVTDISPHDENESKITKLDLIPEKSDDSMRHETENQTDTSDKMFTESDEIFTPKKESDATTQSHSFSVKPVNISVPYETAYENPSTDKQKDITYQYVTTFSSLSSAKPESFHNGTSEDIISTSTIKYDDINSQNESDSESYGYSDYPKFPQTVLPEIIEKKHGNNDVFDVPPEVLTGDKKINETLTTVKSEDDSRLHEPTSNASSLEKDISEISEHDYKLHTVKPHQGTSEILEVKHTTVSYSSSSTSHETKQSTLGRLKTKLKPTTTASPLTALSKNMTSITTSPVTESDDYIKSETTEETGDEPQTLADFEHDGERLSTGQPITQISELHIVPHSHESSSETITENEKEIHQSQSDITSTQNIIYNITAKIEHDLKRYNLSTTPVPFVEYQTTHAHDEILTKTQTENKFETTESSSIFKLPDDLDNSGQAFNILHNETDLKVPSEHASDLKVGEVSTLEELLETTSNSPYDKSDVDFKTTTEDSITEAHSDTSPPPSTTHIITSTKVTFYPELNKTDLEVSDSFAQDYIHSQHSSTEKITEDAAETSSHDDIGVMGITEDHVTHETNETETSSPSALQDNVTYADYLARTQNKTDIFATDLAEKQGVSVTSPIKSIKTSYTFKYQDESSPPSEWVAHTLDDEVMKELSTVFPASPTSLVYETHSSSTSGTSAFPIVTQSDSEVCYFEGKVYLTSEQIPRSHVCEFCFCFKGDIICLQQTCPPPIKGCFAIPIDGFCCPRYHCPVQQMWIETSSNTQTPASTTLFPISRFIPQRKVQTPVVSGCRVDGTTYGLHDVVWKASTACMLCRCDYGGIMQCDPQPCKPDEPTIQHIYAQTYHKK